MKKSESRKVGKSESRKVRPKMLMIMLASMLMVIGCQVLPAFAATKYASSAVNLQAIAWGTGGLPDTANAVWRFASSDGLDFDTLGATGYRNYGKTTLGAQLTNANQPGLSEGVMQPHQGALAFNGAANYLSISAAFPPITATSFTIVVWVRNLSNVASGIFDQRDGVDLCTIRLAYSANPFFTIRDNVGNLMFMDAGVALSSGTWHFLALTYSRSDSAKLYLDGAKIAALINNNTGNYTTGLTAIDVGRYNAANYANMDLAWMGIWNGTVLSSAQLSALRTATLPLGTAASPFPSVQSAIYAASAGDTILVQPGRYQETIVSAQVLKCWSAQEGSRAELYGAALPAAAGTVGATVSADNELRFLTFRGYIAAQGLLATATSDGSLFHHLEFDSCLNAVDFDSTASGDSLVNCTIDGASLPGSTGFRATTSSAVTVVVENCIFVNCATALTKAALQTLTEDHNDFFGNTSNYAAALHATDLTVNPQFRGSYVPHNIQMKLGLAIHSQAAPFDRVHIGVWFPLVNQLLAGGGRAWGGRGPWARTGGDK